MELCDMTTESVWAAYTDACDELATVRAEKEELEAKYNRLLFCINIDRDGDGFISREALREILPELE